MNPPRVHRPVDAALRLVRERLRASAPGTRLPSQPQLAAQFGLSLASVNRAVAQLVASQEIVRVGRRLQASPAAARGPIHVRFLALTPRHPIRPPASATFPGVDLTVRYWRLEENIEEELDRARRDGAEAVALVTAGSLQPSGIASVRRAAADLPIVCVGTFPVPGAGYVQPDPVGLVHRAQDELIRLGYRHLRGLVFGLDSAFNRALLSAWHAPRQGVEVAADSVEFFGKQSPGALIEPVVREVARSSEPVGWLIQGGGLLLPLATRLAEAGLLPERAGLVSVGDGPLLRSSLPSISAVHVPFEWMVSSGVWAAAQMALEVRRGLRPAPPSVALQPVFLARSTTRRASDAMAAGTAVAGVAWPEEPEERRALVVAQNARPLDVDFVGAEPVPVDLEPWFNRNAHRTGGWFSTTPLPLFPRAVRWHGVPFRLGNVRRRNAVLLRSSHHPEPLPEAVEIPVGRRIAGACFVVGCGFGSEGGPCGRIEVVRAGRAPEVVPLVSAGWMQRPDANLQDWWPTYGRPPGLAAREVLVAVDGDPFRGERYVYIVPVVTDPRAGPVASLRLAGVPRDPVTLGLLAVTVFVPRGAG